MTLLDINYTLFSVFDYKLSLIELIGILSGLASVYYATRMNILTWPIGLVNAAALFIIFYQVQLYSDMFLQSFFAVVTVYGWKKWKKAAPVDAHSAISVGKFQWSSIALVIILTIALGSLMSKIHEILPSFFAHAAAFPYQDGFTTAASIAATWLLAKRALENWVLWIVVDVVSIYLYMLRDIPFMAFLYFAFLVLATRGLLKWTEELKHAYRSGIWQILSPTHRARGTNQLC